MYVSKKHLAVLLALTLLLVFTIGSSAINKGKRGLIQVISLHSSGEHSDGSVTTAWTRTTATIPKGPKYEFGVNKKLVNTMWCTFEGSGAEAMASGAEYVYQLESDGIVISNDALEFARIWSSYFDDLSANGYEVFEIHKNQMTDSLYSMTYYIRPKL